MPDVRIKDVAKHAGVSEATITRVVNNKGYVSEKTRKRVLESVETLGYIPNRMASALKNRRTGIIGNVIALSMDNPFFTAVTKAIKNAALSYGYQILPMDHEPNRGLEDRLLHEVISNMVEGVIFTGMVKSSKKAIKEVLDKQMPVVMIERPLDMAGVDKVLIDDMAGSSLAADAFLAMGHKTMGFIGEKPGPQRVEHDRFFGFKQTLEKNNLSLKDQLIVFARDYTVEYGYDAMKQLIEQNGKNRPTACFITADTLACGALQYLYDAKLRVPEDISVIGYDNTLSALCSPPITAVALPYNEIGATAVSLFWERQEQNRHIDKTVQLSPFIVDRGSVADIRNNREKQTTY